MIECCPECRDIIFEKIGEDEYECQNCFCIFREDESIIREPLYNMVINNENDRI